jgi:hypothetical protein
MQTARDHLNVPQRSLDSEHEVAEVWGLGISLFRVQFPADTDE